MITLQEITPYIPHNLKARLSQKGKFNLDSEYPNEYQNKIGQIKLWTIDNKGIGGILQITDNYYFDFCEIDEIQIFVRPWSDITREIEHNGEKFVPIVEFAKIASKNTIREKDEILNFSKCIKVSMRHPLLAQCEILIGGLTFYFQYDYEYNIFVMRDINRKHVAFLNQIELFQKLFEWHFDVFGLIERGDAIDINTLPK